MNVIEHFIVEGKLTKYDGYSQMRVNYNQTEVYNALGLGDYYFNNWSFIVDCDGHDMVVEGDTTFTELHLNDLIRFAFHAYLYDKTIHGENELYQEERYLLSISALFILKHAERFID